MSILPAKDYQEYQEYLATKSNRVTQDDNLPKVEGNGRGPGRGGGGKTRKGNGGRSGRSGQGVGGTSSGCLNRFSSDRGINLEPEIGEDMAEELLQSIEEAKIKGDEGCV